MQYDTHAIVISIPFKNCDEISSSPYKLSLVHYVFAIGICGAQAQNTRPIIPHEHLNH